MPDRPDFARLADFLQEPLLALTMRGEVTFANRAALGAFGPDVVGADLPSRVAGGREDLLRYLQKCAGSGHPMIGALTLRGATGEKERRLQVEGALLRPASNGEASTILLRVRPRGGEGFSILGRKIDDLNREVRQRRRVQVALEESLAEKETLLRELQHRTKNHTQMLLGMFSAAAAQAQTDEARVLVQAALSRLRAIGAAQQLMYEVERFDSVRSDELVEGVCRAIADTWPASVALDVHADEADLPNDVAVPVALIVNELLSNALKHGLRFESGRVAVELVRRDPELVLEVRDDGPGMPESAAERRSSGLSIVRGLCRQIGGVFEMNGENGMRVTVRFPNPELRGAPR